MRKAGSCHVCARVRDEVPSGFVNFVLTLVSDPDRDAVLRRRVGRVRESQSANILRFISGSVAGSVVVRSVFTTTGRPWDMASDAALLTFM